MTLVHTRRFQLQLVKSGLIVLGFADYFGMTAIAAKAYSFLLSSALPRELLIDGLELADKLPHNVEILEWVLKAIPDNNTFFQILHDSLPLISLPTAQYCLKKLQERTNLPNRDVQKLNTQISDTIKCYPNLASLKFSLPPGKVALDFRYRIKASVVKQLYFAVDIAPTRQCHDSGKTYIKMSDIWRLVPCEVSCVSINGEFCYRNLEYPNGETSIRVL